MKNTEYLLIQDILLDASSPIWAFEVPDQLVGKLIDRSSDPLTQC